MPPRPAIPVDDLYATLGVPVDASPEAIEIAWRGLLRRHHPDVAGEEGLALAKRINVAHDWLADADLRRRYDEVRRPVPPPWAGAGWRARPGEGGRAESTGRRQPHRPPTMAELVTDVVERVRVLTRDELDRLSLAEPAPIAFLATLRRFVAPDLAATLDDASRRALAGLPQAARMRPAIRDAIEGQLASIVLAETLVDLLGDAAAERASERLTRGWDAAVGKPRYGPATSAVTTLLTDLAALDSDGVAALAATGGRDRLGDTPWPDAASPEEDEAVRVSSELAAIDATAALARAPIGARRAAARIAHLLCLRHAFPTAAFERLAAPWLGGLIPAEVRRSRPVRRPK
jgi:curved DNA-binding protein CbpA